MTAAPTRRTMLRGSVPGAYSLAIAVVLLLAATARLIAALRLPPHVDESASLLAAKMVVEDGIPRFPSGLLYTQGASLSYLLAPIFAVVDHGPDHLFALRLVSVLVGSAAVYAVSRLTLVAFDSPIAAVIAALLLAMDPTSVRWSGHVRMYALLQLLGIALAWMFVRSCARPVNRRIGIGFAVLWIVAAFTHLAAMLLWPAFALVALARFRRRLLSDQRGLALTLALAPIGPLVLLATNRLVRPPGRETSDELGRVSFVGDHLIDLDRLRDPSFSAWTAFFADLPAPALAPWVMLGASALVLAAPFVTPRVPSGTHAVWNAAALVGCYWGPVLVVALFFGESHDRYLLHVQAIGLVIVGSLMGLVLPMDPGITTLLGRSSPPEPASAIRTAPESGGPGRLSPR